MGVFFYTNSVALIEDIPLEEEYNTEGELRSAMDAGFQQVILIKMREIPIRKIVMWFAELEFLVKNWWKLF